VRPHDTHIVIVGNGVAGNSAASAIRSTSKETAITIISQEPFPEYSACTLSKKYLSGEMGREGVFLKATEDYSREKIATIFGQKVTEIDTRGKKLILEQGKIAYDKLILATGGNPVVPPLSGVEKEGIFTLKSLADADSIFHYSGRKAVVIGAGAIGVEASISLRTLRSL
jgi:NAD(P)H-nitrite reductase large subunit